MMKNISVADVFSQESFGMPKFYIIQRHESTAFSTFLDFSKNNDNVNISKIFIFLKRLSLFKNLKNSCKL